MSHTEVLPNAPTFRKKHAKHFEHLSVGLSTRTTNTPQTRQWRARIRHDQSALGKTLIPKREPRATVDHRPRTNETRLPLVDVELERELGLEAQSTPKRPERLAFDGHTALLPSRLQAVVSHST